MKRTRRLVTLLEMILVMALLSIVGSIAGYLSYSASKKEEFNAATQAISARLKLAEELMWLGCDITVRFVKQQNGFHVIIDPDRPLDAGTMRLLSIPAPITGIENVIQETPEIIPMDSIQLIYASFGMKRPLGRLTVEGPHGKRILPLNDSSNLNLTSELLYPNEVLQKAT